MVLAPFKDVGGHQLSRAFHITEINQFNATVHIAQGDGKQAALCARTGDLQFIGVRPVLPPITSS
jgi:hypothetical protein